MLAGIIIGVALVIIVLSILAWHWTRPDPAPDDPGPPKRTVTTVAPEWQGMTEATVRNIDGIESRMEIDGSYRPGDMFVIGTDPYTVVRMHRVP